MKINKIFAAIIIAILFLVCYNESPAHPNHYTNSLHIKLISWGDINRDTKGKYFLIRKILVENQEYLIFLDSVSGSNFQVIKHRAAVSKSLRRSGLYP